MANGNGNGRDSSERLIEDYRRLVEECASEDDSKRQIAHLRDFVFANAANVSKQIRALRECLPWRPWMVRLFGGVGVAGLAIVIMWLTTLNNTATAANARSIESEAKIQQLSVGQAEILAKLDMLLKAGGVEVPKEGHGAGDTRGKF